MKFSNHTAPAVFRNIFLNLKYIDLSSFFSLNSKKYFNISPLLVQVRYFFFHVFSSLHMKHIELASDSVYYSPLKK